MAHVIIDRRKNDKGRSTENRQRFIKRVKDQVREAVKDVIRNGSIKEVLSKNKKQIKIPGKGLEQPTFEHDRDGGIKDHVNPGNKRFRQGDRAPRPQGGEGGGGREGSNEDADMDDAFTFSLTREEFLDVFFQDLELPELIKKQISKIDEYVTRRAGYTVNGSPSRLNVLRSMKNAKGRRFALRNPKRKEIKELEQQRQVLLDRVNQAEFRDEIVDEINLQIAALNLQIEALKRKIKAVPFVDDVDLRYNHWDKVAVPTTQAVMFGIMDVSASMGEWEKEMAKRFFMLLLLFLNYNYERVDIVWIRHTTTAQQVSEEEFFYSRETGGTMVSPALELMDELIKTKYPVAQWNIFACQISDGDNWYGDSTHAASVLTEKLLPLTRFFAYVEIDQGGGKDSDLWPYYDTICQNNENMVMSVISGPEQIYPVFRSLFEKRK